MEKMRGDMLEMILNSPRGRITEKETKFLIHQVCRNSRIYSSLIELLQLFLSFSCFLFLVSCFISTLVYSFLYLFVRIIRLFFRVFILCFFIHFLFRHYSL